MTKQKKACKATALLLSVLLMISLIPFSGLFTASAVDLPVSDKVSLDWMRSSETKTEAFVKPITGASDAWIYQNALESTKLEYFSNDETKALANAKAATGNEYVAASQSVDSSLIWDNGTFFSKYKEVNGQVSYDWASWKHFGKNHSLSSAGEYSVRRFTSYFDLTASNYANLEQAILAPQDELGNMNYLFPINDTVFVFVNGVLAFWGGTDIIEGNNVWGALTRQEFMGMNGLKVRNGVNAVLKDTYPHTDGWCIDLEQNAQAINIKDLLQAGENRIDVFADDYWEGGGMNKLDLFVTSQPSISTIKEVFHNDGITPVTEKLEPGTIITYKITVTSTGLVPTGDISITDVVPDFTSYVEGEGGTLIGETVTWPTFSLAAQGKGTPELPDTFTVEFKVQIDSDAYNKTIPNVGKVNGEDTNIVTVETIDKSVGVSALSKGLIPENVVVVLDMSNTMKTSASLTPAINGVKALVNSIYDANSSAIINLVTFNYRAYDLKTADYEHRTEMISVIDSLNTSMATNGTNMANALDIAKANLETLQAARPDSQSFIIFVGDGQAHNSNQVTPLDEFGKKPSEYADPRNSTDDPSGIYAITDAVKAEGYKLFSIYYGPKLSDVPAGEKRQLQQKGMNILTAMSSNTVTDKTYYYNTNTGGQLQAAMATIATKVQTWEATTSSTVLAQTGIAVIDISRGFVLNAAAPLSVSINGIVTTYTSVAALPAYISYDSIAQTLTVDTTMLPASDIINITYYETSV